MAERYNFYSDTQTIPSRAMREAALSAELGDEQSGADPTTNALCERMADLLGKEAAVFLPSGTMCNEIAIAVHCRPGDEVICERSSHIIGFEAGGPAAISGVMIHALDGDRGTFSPEAVAGAIRAPSRYAPLSRLVSVEQTANLAGGNVWEIAQLDAVAAVAHGAGLATHMDGARLMNAVVASGRPAAQHAAGYDSVWVDFTKGLGCPVGAVLAGSRDFIDAAWRFKQRWGGAMRQSGILAAMCLYALDHHVERLSQDHALAASLVARLAELPLVSSVLPTPTNLIFLDLAESAPDAEQVTQALAAHGIRVGPFGARQLRIVTHLDVGLDAANALIDALARIPLGASQ